MDESKFFSFNYLLERRFEEDGPELVKHVSKFLRFYKFVREPNTEWAYRKVLSHLEDGWTCLSQSCELNEFSESSGMSIDNIGQIVNLIIRGKQYIISEGDWPTRHDLAAFVYFVSLKTDREIKSDLYESGC